MKATKAYIASLGTTGVLLGASLLMLAVVSAVVAFDRWPAGTVSSRVQPIVLKDQSAPIQVTANPAAAVRTGAGLPGAAARGVAGGGPLLQGLGAPGAGGGAPGPNAPAGAPRLPLPAQSPIGLGNPPSPDRVRSQIADQGQAVTTTAGAAAGTVSPPAGQVVTGAGNAAADTVRRLPLPGSILPHG